MMKKSLMVILCTMILFTGCKRENEPTEKIKRVRTTITNHYYKNRSVSFPGKVKAANEINLSFRISGPIVKVNASQGQFVRKGEVLAEMDSRDYAIQFAATEAEYNAVRAEVERIVQLYEKNSVPENDYDKAVSALTQMTSKYNAHKNALEDTKLIAPFDGYIQKRYYNRDETISAGMPIFSIISAYDPEVEINIPASEFIRRESFDSYRCHFDIYPDREFPLELISINQKANLNQLYTVRFRLKECGKESPTPGISTMVTIDFKSDGTDLFSIPLSAMFEMENGPAVWVYNEKTERVSARRIKPSEILTDGSLVVSEGLQEGDIVVTAGVHALSENERVKLMPKSSEANVGGLL